MPKERNLENYKYLQLKDNYTKSELEAEIKNYHTYMVDTISKPLKDKLTIYENKELKSRLKDKVNNNFIDEFIVMNNITNEIKDDEIINILNNEKNEKYKNIQQLTAYKNQSSNNNQKNESNDDTIKNNVGNEYF